MSEPSEPRLKVLVKDSGGQWWLFDDVPQTDWEFIDKNINPEYHIQPQEDGTPVLGCNIIGEDRIKLGKRVTNVRVRMKRDGND